MNMTNKAVLIHDLKNNTEQSDLILACYIACPYGYRSPRCRNWLEVDKLESAESREICSECKVEWLNKDWKG